MKELLKNFISKLPMFWIGIGLISLISGLIFGLNIGVYTFIGIGLTFILFVWLRQLYWWFTSTGDFKK